jgi:hypothetical protein
MELDHCVRLFRIKVTSLKQTMYLFYQAPFRPARKGTEDEAQILLL